MKPTKQKTKLKNSKNLFPRVWFNPKNPSGFSGIKKLKKATSSNTKTTQKWLSSQLAYTLHRPMRKRFPVRPYKTSGINDLWQMDLMEMIPYATINDGYKYILNVIDVFSRFVRSVPIRQKTGIEIESALKVVFKSEHPRHVQTDEGKEFYNHTVKQLFQKLKINHYSVFSQFKAPLVERFNRTLRERLSKYFTKVGNKKWITVLPDIIHSYNNSVHRSIQMKPCDVNKRNESDLWTKQNSRIVKTKSKIRHAIGDYVRVSKINNSPFIKNFNTNWSDEVFQIELVNDKDVPIMYKIVDVEGKTVGGKFYHEELQVIDKPELYRIEKVLKTTGVGKSKRHYVKWVGYKTPTWIKDSDINI